MKLPENTILLVEVGSTAHGTGIDSQEDHDEIAIVVETPKQVFIRGAQLNNRMDRTQPEGARSGPGDTDRQVYSLRNFVDLALSGNPSILIALWAPVIQTSQGGRQLRALGPQFVSRACIPKFRGYAHGQAMRLLGLKSGVHGRRGGGGREEIIAQHGYDTKYAMHCARLGFQCIELLTQRHLQLPIQGVAGKVLRDIRYGKVSKDNWFDIVTDLDQRMERLLSAKDIPAQPNYDRIHDWTVRTHLDFWSGKLT